MASKSEKKRKDIQMNAANDKDGEKASELAKQTLETTERRHVQAKYEFTVSEKADVAAKLAQRQIELVEKDDEKKTVMAGFTDHLKRIKLDIGKLSRSYRDGWEYREYEVTIVMDYKKREKCFRDVISGKIVDRQPFAPGDEQLRFQ